MDNDFFGRLLSLVNMLFGMAMLGTNVAFLLTHKKWEPYTWVKVSQAVLGVYFAALYASILLDVLPSEQVFTTIFATTFIRPAITLMLASSLSGSILRYRAQRRNC